MLWIYEIGIVMVHSQVEMTVDIHELNYMIFLRMFILIIIKINDDFCIYTENKFKAPN
jgi:hypothetical protein